MVEASTPLRILFLAQESINIPKLIARMKTPLTDNYEICTTLEQYEALTDKYSYDVCSVSWGTHVPIILNDQTNNSQKIKWVHAITAGVDMYLTNA